MTNGCGPILLPRAVHDSPAASGRGGQRPVSRREVLKYAVSAPVLLSLGTVAATVDGQKASAANIRLIDFTERLVPPDQIKSAGYDGALVYVSESRPGANFDFKPVTREYADALRAAGLHVVSCYQYGKPGWPTRRTSPAGTTAAWQTLRQLCGCTLRPEVGIRRRSSSVSMRISTSTPGKALLSSGFEESTRYWALTAPASMDIFARVGGRSKTA